MNPTPEGLGAATAFLGAAGRFYLAGDTLIPAGSPQLSRRGRRFLEAATATLEHSSSVDPSVRKSGLQEWRAHWRGLTRGQGSPPPPLLDFAIRTLTDESLPYYSLQELHLRCERHPDATSVQQAIALSACVARTLVDAHPGSGEQCVLIRPEGIAAVGDDGSLTPLPDLVSAVSAVIEAVHLHVTAQRAVFWRPLGRPIATLAVDLLDTGLARPETLVAILERLAPHQAVAARSLVTLHARAGNTSAALENGARFHLPTSSTASDIIHNHPDLWDPTSDVTLLSHLLTCGDSDSPMSTAVSMVAAVAARARSDQLDGPTLLNMISNCDWLRTGLDMARADEAGRRLAARLALLAWANGQCSPVDPWPWDIWARMWGEEQFEALDPLLRAALVQELADRPPAAASDDQVRDQRTRLGRELLRDGAENRAAPLRDLTPAEATAALSLAAADPHALPLRGWIPRDEEQLRQSLRQAAQPAQINDQGLQAVLKLCPEAVDDPDRYIQDRRGIGRTSQEIWVQLSQPGGALDKHRGRWPQYVLEMLASNVELGTVLLALRALGKADLGWEPALFNRLNTQQRVEQAVYALAAAPATALAAFDHSMRRDRLPWGLRDADGYLVIGDLRPDLDNRQRLALLSLIWPESSPASYRQDGAAVWFDGLPADQWSRGSIAERVGLAAVRALDLGRPDIVGDCLLLVLRRPDALDIAWSVLTGIHPREDLAQLSHHLSLDSAVWHLPEFPLHRETVSRQYPRLTSQHSALRAVN